MKNNRFANFHLSIRLPFTRCTLQRISIHGGHYTTENLTNWCACTGYNTLICLRKLCIAFTHQHGIPLTGSGYTKTNGRRQKILYFSSCGNSVTRLFSVIAGVVICITAIPFSFNSVIGSISAGRNFHLLHFVLGALVLFFVFSSSGPYPALVMKWAWAAEHAAQIQQRKTNPVLSKGSGGTVRRPCDALLFHHW